MTKLWILTQTQEYTNHTLEVKILDIYYYYLEQYCVLKCNVLLGNRNTDGWIKTKHTQKIELQKTC